MVPRRQFLLSPLNPDSMHPHPFEQEQQTCKIYQVDAFTQQLFQGNPAAVCLLKNWLPEHKLQQIAAENNLSETAFLVQTGYFYDIRWFTPTVEVDLCGHATLAAAHVLFQHESVLEDIVYFNSRSGELKVRRDRHRENYYTLDFPEDLPVLMELPPAALQANVEAEAFLKASNTYLLRLPSEKALREFVPPLEHWAGLKEVIGVIVTAKGDACDFVSRCFFPQAGIDEDPVTGSAHTVLAPYWAKELGKKELSAQQLSSRRGFLSCHYLGNRVEISGYASTYLIGTIFLQN